jgi:molybdenum cofactor cytidylyltransferase
LGGGADEVRAYVGLDGLTVVENPAYGGGCSSSIAAALPALDPRCDLLVLMLGDQPGVGPATVSALVAGRGEAPMAVCRYDDGRGHPFAFTRALFPELASLHGDKAVWKLLDRLGDGVAEVAVPGPVPPDVDTWEDYEALAGPQELRTA